MVWGKMDSGEACNVVLVGFMGTGKTTVGQKVAKGLGFEFVDTDREVEEETGRSIPEIFSEEGESGFRAREAAVLKKVLDRDHQVISTGGGIVLREENRKAIREGGFCIWLIAEPDVILERVQSNSNRPLLQTPDPLKTIRQLLDDREHDYADVADLKIATAGLHPDDVAFGICESARVNFS